MSQVALPAAPGHSRSQTAIGVTLLLAAAAAMALVSQREAEFGAFAGLGVALGFVMQRSRFCFTAAFRDLFMRGCGVPAGTESSPM